MPEDGKKKKCGQVAPIVLLEPHIQNFFKKKTKNKKQKTNKHPPR